MTDAQAPTHTPLPRSLRMLQPPLTEQERDTARALLAAGTSHAATLIAIKEARLTPDQTQANRQRRYDHLMATLEIAVTDLNRLLGYTGTDLDAPKITVGYIGNCDHRRPDGTWGYDDRLWSVFLPHPGRVGTYDDRVGAWPTGDPDGVRIALDQVTAMVKIVNHLTEQRLLVGWSTR